MTLLAALALAHSPHDVARFVSLAPDGLVLSADTELLAWSTDGGASFRFRYLEQGEPVCAVAWDAGRWAAAARDGGVWLTLDGGLSFAAIDGPGHPQACASAGDLRWIGGDEGVWVAGEPETWTSLPALPAGVTDLAGGEEVVVLLDDLELYRLEGEGWERLPAPPVRPRRVALDGLDPVVGTIDGGLFRLDGDTWVERSGSPLDVHTLAIDGARWVAATADEGVWTSEDGGETWILEDEGFERPASGPGSPTDGVHFLDLGLREGVAWSAQWEGLWSRAPDEDRWTQANLDILPRVRTVAPLPDGTVLVGSYGGGVYRGTPGDTDWALVSGGVGWPYPKQILVLDEARWLVVSGSVLYRTLDAGESWLEAPIPVDEVGDHVAAAGERILAGARVDEHGAVAVSADGGETWEVVALPGDCDEKPAAVETDGVDAWLGCGSRGELYRSTDGGASWVLVNTLGYNVRDLLLAEPVLLATDLGVLATTDGVDLAAVALPEEVVDRVVLAPGGDVWVASPSRGLGSVVDGGFAPVGWPVLDRLEDLAWTAGGTLVAGTRTGAWHSADGAAWAPASGFDWVDDSLQHWWFEGAWEHVDDEEAAGGGVREGGAGAVAELRVVASQVRLVAASPNGAKVSVSVDGGAAERRVLPEEARYGVVWARDLEPGSHVVSLTVDGGRVRVDGAELWREGAPALAGADSGDTGAPEEDPRRCGCGGSGGAAVVGLLCLGWGRRPSRPGGGSPVERPAGLRRVRSAGY